jgi:hypothetical protein
LGGTGGYRKPRPHDVWRPKVLHVVVVAIVRVQCTYTELIQTKAKNRGCDFVSGHTHTRSALFVLYIHATNTARGVSLAHTLDFVHEPFIKGFLKTRKPVDDVVVTNARRFYTL